jgi:RHS repeat-associated protein
VDHFSRACLGHFSRASKEVGHLNPQTPVNPAPQSAFTHFELGRHRLARVKSPISWPSRSLDLANSRTEYYVPDHIGSTYLAGVFGSSYRRIVDAPFGRSAFQYSNGTFDTPYRFTGAERDQTGLYLMGARYLNPPAGKWLSPDPLFIWSPSANLESPREQNLYAYARNNPVRLTDPTGLSTDLGIELRATHPNHPSPPPASLGGMTFGQFWHALNEAILPGYKSMNVVERIASLGQGLVAGKLVETGARLIVNAFQRIQAGTTAAANATLRVQTGVRAGGAGREGTRKPPNTANWELRGSDGRIKTRGVETSGGAIAHSGDASHRDIAW